jgi:hypothetical protein
MGGVSGCKLFSPEGSPENHSMPIIDNLARITVVERREVLVIPPTTTTRRDAEDEGFGISGDTAWSAQWSRRD